MKLWINPRCTVLLALCPGHSQILSHSCGVNSGNCKIKSGSVLGTRLQFYHCIISTHQMNTFQYTIPEFSIAKLALYCIATFFPQFFPQKDRVFFLMLNNNALTHKKNCEIDCGATMHSS